jgi:hypothetical protein
MQFDAYARAGSSMSEAADRRRGGRFRQDGLESSLGEVLDLSVSGMRIRSTTNQKGEIDVELSDRQGTRLRMRCLVAWSKASGSGTFDLGLVFLVRTPAITQQLTRLCMANRPVIKP